MENVGGDEVDKNVGGGLLLLLRQSDDTLRVKHVGGGLRIDGLQRPHFQGEHVALHVGVWLQLLRDAVRLNRKRICMFNISYLMYSILAMMRVVSKYQ